MSRPIPEVTATLIIDGFGGDALAALESIRAHCDVPLVVMINGKQPSVAIPRDAKTEVIEVKQRLGWGNAINSLLEQVTTPYMTVMDPSTRFLGDAITPALEKLREGFAGVGWKGALVNLEDEWRSVDDKGAGEVDVLFSYFMLLDREFTQSIGANPSAKYYRNADLELSLALREAGGRLFQLDLPLEQARHHGYHDVDPDYREKHSKENYNRLLRRFRGKSDILSPRR